MPASSTYSRIVTADLPFNRRPPHSPRHLLLAYPEESLPGVQIPTVPLLLTIQKRLLNVCIWVYTIFLLYHILDLRTFHSISCLSLLLTRDLFRSCPGLLDVVEQGGFGRGVGSPSPQGNLCNPRSLSPELLDVIEQGGNLGAGLRALVTPAKDSERPKCLNSPPHSRRCTSLEPPR